MIILRSQSEYSKSPSFEFRCLVRVCWTEESLHVEIFTLYPNLCGTGDFVEDDATAIRWGDRDGRIIGSSRRSSIRFEFAVKELVKSEVLD